MRKKDNLYHTKIGDSMKKGNYKNILLIILILVIVLILVLLIFDQNKEEIPINRYICSATSNVILYDLNYNEVSKIDRGEEVEVYKFKEKKEDKVYIKIKYKGEYYLIDQDNLTINKEDIIKEKELFVRTNLTVYKDLKSSNILSYIKKGERVEILGYDKIIEGVVNKYYIKYDDIEGYVYGKYLVSTLEDSQKLYDENGIQEYMLKMGNSLGGGTATNLDYYPYKKPTFKDNKMPDEVRSIYINSDAVKNINQYIEFAKENNINAFVIDIKDNTNPAYNSPVMKKYSLTNYNRAINDYDKYKSYISKAKEEGIYLIGRITVFKDSYFVKDHKEVAIKNSNGDPFSHNGSYWPSAYNRLVWEFNVELAKEAVTSLGFNEIQFDYVRFPDRTTKLEKEGVINLGNIYEEEKAQAIQNFVMYACDEIHELGAYVSIDVFGESASNYVTAYGQFWPAISNIADVISGMPYPDHFNPHEYGIKEVVWTVPYKLLDNWSKYVLSKQEIIPTPAVVRTWIQTYDTKKSPSVIYDETKISEQIKALYDNGLNGGFMTWNSLSNMIKYKEISYALKKVYE